MISGRIEREGQQYEQHTNLVRSRNARRPQIERSGTGRCQRTMTMNREKDCPDRVCRQMPADSPELERVGCDSAIIASGLSSTAGLLLCLDRECFPVEMQLRPVSIDDSSRVLCGVDIPRTASRVR
jgi:hypothetical protein